MRDTIAMVLAYVGVMVGAIGAINFIVQKGAITMNKRKMIYLNEQEKLFTDDKQRLRLKMLSNNEI